MGRFLAGVAIVAALVAAPGVRAESLGDALASAYRNSDLLEQNRALLRARDEGLSRRCAPSSPLRRMRAIRSCATTASRAARTPRPGCG